MTPATNRPLLAPVAVAAVLLVVVGAAVWLGGRGGAPSQSAAPSVPATAASIEPGTPSTVPPTTSASGPGASDPVPPTAPPVAVLVGAGDISGCDSNGDEATAQLLLSIPGTVFTLGDNVYEDGTARQFRDCYGPTWGRDSIKARTRPVVGNHEYRTEDASGYFSYFGAAAGDPSEGWYAYDAGAWRVYALNTQCGEVGGCDAGSAQEQWLRAELAANPRDCVAALWHHPRFSSGPHGSSTATQALYQALYDFDAELIVTGHDHLYERFAPQTPTGAADDARGIVQIIAGMGGRSHYDVENVRANSLVRNADTFGVLKLTLSPGSWLSEFVPVAGKSFTDTGGGTCH